MKKFVREGRVLKTKCAGGERGRVNALRSRLKSASEKTWEQNIFIKESRRVRNPRRTAGAKANYLDSKYEKKNKKQL